MLGLGVSKHHKLSPLMAANPVAVKTRDVTGSLPMIFFLSVLLLPKKTQKHSQNKHSWNYETTLRFARLAPVH